MFKPISAPPPPEAKITADDFKEGVITLIEETRLPLSAAKEATNLWQTQDGRYSTRPGTATYGASHAATIDGAAEYRKTDGTTELITISNGVAYKSTNGGSVSSISGATFTAGTLCRFKQINSRLYISNGVDNLAYYDGTNLQVYATISAPQSAAAAKTGLTNGTYQAYYQVVAINDVGFSLPSTECSVPSGTNKPRDQWTNGSEYVTVTWAAPATNAAGVRRYEIYYSDQSGFEVFLDSVEASVLTYKDTGQVQYNPYVEVPLDNTTTGPKFTQLELSGNRLWGTGDTNNKYRVYGSGTGKEIGYFSEFYGGFYVDLEKGGREYPSTVKHFRDGRGDGQATVFTSAPDGTGSTWQINPSETTVGDTSFIIPISIKVVGGLGTNAPDSVVTVGTSLMFGNKRGWFSLGSQPNLLNILATAELSSNIRPTWRGLTGSAMSTMIAFYTDGKVYISVPAGSATQNNQTMIFDTERRNWCPASFTIGFRQFLEYTDTSGNTHLLAIPYSGTQLVEVSDNFQGDLGTAFPTSYISGLYPVAKDRLKWAKIRYLYIEFNQPQGDINVELLGTEKKRGFSSLGSITVSDATTSSGWGSFQFADSQWGDPEDTPTTFAQSSVRKRLRVNKLLNNIQVRVTSSAMNANYTIQGWIVTGYYVPTSDPTSWRT